MLKEFSDSGFVFYTNYLSRKGSDLLVNPQAALLFFWPALERQVRVEGSVAKVSDEDSTAYFAGRPLGSQHGAWASAQSIVIAGREALERSFAEVAQRYGEKVPRPAHWGGYRVVPDSIEFWQGRPNRLHDRLRYTRTDKQWRIDRLAP